MVFFFNTPRGEDQRKPLLERLYHTVWGSVFICWWQDYGQEGDAMIRLQDQADDLTCILLSHTNSEHFLVYIAHFNSI